jgi:hypothetical protein
VEPTHTIHTGLSHPASLAVGHGATSTKIKPHVSF